LETCSYAEETPITANNGKLAIGGKYAKGHGVTRKEGRKKSLKPKKKGGEVRDRSRKEVERRSAQVTKTHKGRRASK